MSVNLTPRFSAVSRATDRKTDTFKGNDLRTPVKTERETPDGRDH